MRKELFGHPVALTVLAATELFVAFAIYSVQALLLIYMAEAIFLPGRVETIVGFGEYRAAVESVTGPLSTRAIATQTFGLYVSLSYLLILVGGWFGDGRLGRKRVIILGGLLMTAGYFLLAFDRSFLVAVLLVVIGRGGVSGNLVPQVSESYAKDDRRTADGMQIYFTMVNIGAFVGPVALGAVGAVAGFHLAFAISGIGMLLAVVVYVVGRRHLPADEAPHERAARPPLTKEERRRVKLLLLIWPISTIVWIAQTQVFNAYDLWVTDYVDLHILGWQVPVPWFQAFDSLAPLAMVPALIAFWRWQARRNKEPDELGKMTIGAFMFAAGMAWLAASPLVANPAGKVPLLWALAFHVISNGGWLFYVPLASTLYARTSPKAVAGVMVAVASLAILRRGRHQRTPRWLLREDDADELLADARRHRGGRLSLVRGREPAAAARPRGLVAINDPCRTPGTASFAPSNSCKSDTPP